MYDFALIGKNCNEVGNQAALDTLNMGRAVASWDKKRQKVVKIYPDGHIEDVEEIRDVDSD